MLNEEKPFKDLFDQYKAEPDPEVWTGIKNELLGKKRKKILLFVAVSMIVVSVSLSIFQLVSNLNPNKNELSSQSILTSNTDTALNLMHADSFITENINGVLLNELDKPILAKKHSSNKLHEDLKIREELMDSESTAANSLFFLSQNDSVFSNSVFESQACQLIPCKLFQYNQQVELADRINIKLNPRISKNVVELNIGFGNLNLVKHAADKINIGTNTFQVALYAGKIFKNHEWKLGFQYNYYKQASIHQWNEIEIYTDSMLVKKRYTSELIQHFYQDTIISQRQDSFVNVVHQIKIPLTYQRNWKLSNKWIAYTQLNTSLDYMLSARINTSTSSNRGVTLERTPHATSYSRYGLSLGLGFGGMYTINRQLSLTMGIGTNYQSIGFKSERTPIYLRSIMFNVGLRKNLF